MNSNVPTALTVFIAGDSTAANYAQPQAPMAGWGQMLGHFFKPSVTVRNEARGGRSSKSFIDEGHFGRIEQAMKAGDYLLIQFGHNDQKADEQRHTDPYTTYQQMLSRYVESARARGANPVLLTSVERRKFNASGDLVPSHMDYPDAMKELAERLQVPLLDICTRTQSAYRSLGPEASKAWFVWLEPGEHPNYPEGIQDNTHFNETGAFEVARLIAEEMRNSGIPLAQQLGGTIDHSAIAALAENNEVSHT